MIIKHNGAVLLIQFGKKQYKVINVLLVTEKWWFEELMETILTEFGGPGAKLL